ncbi:hypothetical protein SDC9_173491 [bioreactor metagenome]|uniref:Uncharacterized protein n=1 Tax=bioreactor metagenome TaxID=1076179 RepID=A0A645GJR1_9ZZZZ|nr:hypothetical protein [Rikenellaceae bacterium]
MKDNTEKQKWEQPVIIDLTIEKTEKDFSGTESLDVFGPAAS